MKVYLLLDGQNVTSCLMDEYPGAIEVEIADDFDISTVLYCQLTDGELVYSAERELESKQAESDYISSLGTKTRIAELKRLLSDTDYAGIKIAEGVSTKEEYADIISQRQTWREEINNLETQC